VFSQSRGKSCERRPTQRSGIERNSHEKSHQEKLRKWGKGGKDPGKAGTASGEICVRKKRRRRKRNRREVIRHSKESHHQFNSMKRGPEGPRLKESRRRPKEEKSRDWGRNEG